jgi:two-component system, OmpR family, phosphate regulon sensor histidine kinase PhoR
VLSVKRRVGAGFATLVVLFLAVVLVQLVVTDRLQTRTQAHSDRLERARNANEAVLQNMTDAETGVRGFQLTGEKIFLTPYDSGRIGAFTAFDEVSARIRGAEVLRLLDVERQRAVHWLYAYAIPIVNAGVADGDEARAVRGRKLFDEIRTANAAVDVAIRAEQRAVARSDRRQAHLAQLLFAGLAAALLLVALSLAAMHQRQLLAPLEHIRHTLRRLAEGDRSARAVPAGPAEMRAVIGTLNDLAARTERLLDAEQARSVRNELRQAVAAELQAGRDMTATGGRIAELIGTTLGAAAVYCRIAVDTGRGAEVSWPADAPEPDPATIATVLTGMPGEVVTVSVAHGAIAVPLGADADCRPGMVLLARPDRPDWTPDERRLLTAIGREIDYAVRQLRLHQRQARLISELRVLDQRKDAFVATVTHELRTPLTSILGYTEMLTDGDGGDLTDVQRRGVSAILRNAVRLRETVGDLMTLDRAAGRTGSGATPVDLAVLAAGVHGELAPAAAAKDLLITVNAEHVWVHGDAGQLQRVLRSLLGNAIKFTGPGGRVGCRLGAVDGSAVVTVTDTGMGIPEADLPGLFTPFHRAANAMDRAVQGSGLGLAIVRTIVAEHGGAVAVRSRVDEGSTFTVTLPAIGAPTGDREPRAADGGRPAVRVPS